jgi:flavorubredoxin
MHHTVKITDKIHWIGVNDRKTHLFENLWPLDNGISYNSYLINDEQVALIDTVHHCSVETYIEKIQDIIGMDRSIDYLIINHMEPDHSGAIQAIVEKFPNIRIVGNKKTFKMLEAYYGFRENLYEINNDDELRLGDHHLRFIMTPWVHWPETMMTYEKSSKMLFSGDAFGTFGALDGGIFDDEINFDFYRDEMRRYFSNIVGKYSNMVQKAFKKLEGIEINIVASTHGPIWRSEPEKVLSLYDRWSRYESETGVVIIFGSMYGNTEMMADFTARRLSEKGIKNIRVHDASKTHLSYLINEVWRFKGVMLGSSAYNTRMLPTMEQFIHTIEHIAPKNRLLGIFGSYSWTGGGVKSLKQFAENIDWDMVGEPVDIKGIPGEAAFSDCVRLADKMADQLLHG